jgi:outer membrane protein assembly factor BamB
MSGQRFSLNRQLAALGVASCLVLSACHDLVDLFGSPESRVDPKSLLVWRDPQIQHTSTVLVGTVAVYALGLQHVLSAVDKSDGHLLWQTTLPVQESGYFGRGLAVASGVLVVGDNDILGLDPTTGVIRWKFVPSTGFRPGYDILATDGTVVYSASQSGHMFAIDAQTGRERWATQIVDDTLTNVYKPTLAGTTVYAAYTRFDSTVAGTLHGGIAAVDAASGRLLWTVEIPKAYPTEDTGVFTIAVTPTLVIAMETSGRMYALDRTTGETRYQLPVSEFNPLRLNTTNMTDIASLAVNPAGTVVFVGSSALRSLTAISTDDLHRLWRNSYTFGSVVGVTADADRVYANAPGGQFTAFDAATGATVWWVNRWDLRPSDGYEGLVFPPALDGDRIYSGGFLEFYAFKKR